MVVGRRYAGMPGKGEEEFLLGSYEIASESLGRFETKGLFADVVQFFDGAFFDLRRLLPGEFAGFEFLSHVAQT